MEWLKLVGLLPKAVGYVRQVQRCRRHRLKPAKNMSYPPHAFWLENKNCYIWTENVMQTPATAGFPDQSHYFWQIRCCRCDYVVGVGAHSTL